MKQGRLSSIVETQEADWRHQYQTKTGARQLCIQKFRMFVQEAQLGQDIVDWTDNMISFHVSRR
jgi:hypothetical protein